MHERLVVGKCYEPRQIERPMSKGQFYKDPSSDYFPSWSNSSGIK